jgi:hypothetical protein
MLDDNGFRQLTDEIMALGYNEAAAANFAALIGDTPIRDQDDNIAVIDEDKKVLARLKLKSFGASGTGQ